MSAEGRQFMGGATANTAAATGDYHGLPLEQIGFED